MTAAKQPVAVVVVGDLVGGALFADLLFYVLLTPVWIGLRWLAWLAEFRARRR